MPRLIIYVTSEKAAQLKAIAQRERRDPRAQAALFVERAIARHLLKQREVPMA